MKNKKRVRFIKRYSEYISKEEYISIPHGTRGIYALLKLIKNNKDKKKDRYDVVYIGMSCKSIRRRIKSHQKKTSRKRNLWTHFSVYEVNDNIYDDEIGELEGFFRVIYRKDTKANKLNKQKKFKLYRKLNINLDKWNKI